MCIVKNEKARRPMFFENQNNYTPQETVVLQEFSSKGYK